MSAPKFFDVDHAYRIARGDTEALDLIQYYDAWQYLYDNNVTLSLSDELYMDKLICDGSVLTPENYEELGGVPYYPVHVGGSYTTSIEQ